MIAALYYGWADLLSAVSGFNVSRKLVFVSLQSFLHGQQGFLQTLLTK